MSLRHGLLGLLCEGETTGYDLNRSFEGTLAFFWTAQASQIYRELTSMETAGLVRSRVVYQENRPNKKLYAITGAGKKELDDWLARSAGKGELSIRSAFLMQLFFQRPDNTGRLKALLLEFETLNTEDLCALTSVRAYLDALPNDLALPRKLVADFGLRYCQMCADWISDWRTTLDDTDTH